MSLVLELPEELERQLRAEAQEQDSTPEELVIKAVKTVLQDSGHNERVKAAGDYVQRKNAELYRRLA